MSDELELDLKILVREKFDPNTRSWAPVERHQVQHTNLEVGEIKSLETTENDVEYRLRRVL